MEWKIEYATGIHNIDAHHRKLVEFVTLFEDAAQRQTSGNEIRVLLSRAKQFLHFHFGVEEALMRLMPYPEIDAHCAEHQRVLSQLEHFERCAEGEVTPAELADAMRFLLSGHIGGGDKSFAQYAHRLYREVRQARS